MHLDYSDALLSCRKAHPSAPGAASDMPGVGSPKVLLARVAVLRDVDERFAGGRERQREAACTLNRSRLGHVV